MELTERKQQILDILLQQSGLGIAAIVKQLPDGTAGSTVNRDLKAMVEDHMLAKTGQGRSTVNKQV